MTAEHEAFGLRLKTHRERCGITLESIADSTKIKRSLLAALERGDVSHFPLGIFRRSFVRSYATAIGLPAEPIVAEFVQLFPEPGEAPFAAPVPSPAPAAPRLVAPSVQEADAGESGLRLTLAADRRIPIPVLRERAAAAAIDGLSILALALTLWMIHASSLSVSLGISAFGFVIARGFSSGRSGVVHWVKSGQKDVSADVASPPASPVAILQPRGARRNANRPGSPRHNHGASRRERMRRAGI